MVLVLCIGDFHVPHRSTDLPQRFKELLQPGKIHHILCTGNLCCRELLEYLRTVCGSIHYVKGDFDVIPGPEDKVITIEEFKIGLCHGHQVVPAGDVAALGILVRRLDVDILLTGHTHIFQVVQNDERLLMNPGSATGAYSIYTDDVVPSFILMDITGNKVDVYIYQMIDGESKVKKMEFVKPPPRTYPKGPKEKFKGAVAKVIESTENEPEDEMKEEKKEEIKERSNEESNGNPPAQE